MNLLILGSGTAALQAERGPSGYYVNIAGKNILLDGGSGTLLKLGKADVSYENIDQIFYTHLHPDHTMDLVPFLFATKNTPGFTRTKKLELFGPIGFKDFFNNLIEVFGQSMLEVDYKMSLTELGETSYDFKDYNVKSMFMQHSENAIGYRFESENKVLVYSGDTAPCDGITTLAEQADVLLLECSFSDGNKSEGHLTYSEAAIIANDAGVKKLILTHIYPPFDEVEILNTVRSKFTGEVVLARDFMRVNIN